jgi:nitrate reductase gamma subunit
VVGVWTDAAGHLADSQLTDDQVAGQADLAETGTIIGMAALFGCEMLIVRRVINRRRMAAWDADWAVTGPAWNRQRW